MRTAGATIAAAVVVLLAGCGSPGRDDEAPVRPAQTAASPSTATTTSATEPPRAAPEFYAPDSPWNTPVPDDAPLDPRSTAYVENLRDQVVRKGATVMIKEYSVPIYRVGPDQPRKRVEITKPAPALQKAWEDVPLPDHPEAAQGTDGALVVYQPSSDTLWEFWRFREEDGVYRADWGGKMRDVSLNPGYYRQRSSPEVEKPFWGFNATKIGGAAGIMTLQELRRGRIDHALYLAIPDARRGVCAAPAHGTDGVTDAPDAIPEGARFRLDPELDVEALDVPPMTKIMARAAQRYGVVVINRAGAVGFAAEDPTQYGGGDPYRDIKGDASPMEIATAFPWQHLQALRLRLRGC